MTPSSNPHCRIGKIRPLGNIELFPGVTRFDLPARLQPDEDVIAILARMLLRAEAGEIRSIAMAWIDSQDVAVTNWQGGEGHVCSTLLGAIHLLAQDYSNVALGRSERVSEPPQEPA